MELVAVTARQYAAIFPAPWHIFNGVPFNQLNESRCETVHYLVFNDEKPRCGIICGQKEGKFLSPFSAPYGGFTTYNEGVKIYYLEQAVELLKNYARSAGCTELQITPPPLFYSDTLIAKMQNVFYRAGFRVTNVELNYHFDIRGVTGDILQAIPAKARNKTRQALQNGLSIQAGNDDENLSRAYEAIRLNRTERGFPLRMSLPQLYDMRSIVKLDSFTVWHEGVVIGAAINYYVSDSVVLIVYWGDVPAYAELKTMNFLSYKLTEYYAARGVKFIDVSYSTENSIPNYGLCEFKENLGCICTPKLNYVISW